MRNRPYLYSEDLRFLDETLNIRKSRTETTFIEDADDTEQDASQSWMTEVFVDIDEGAENGISSKRPKIEYEGPLEDSPKEIQPKEDCEENIVSVLVNLIQKEEDEDRAFFKSITPSVKTLSESSKFEFRIQVMKLINSLKRRDRKLIKLKRERTSNAESDSE